MSRRILCYGDSNTWGESAFSHGRIEDKFQWPNILQEKLGRDFKVVQEGVCGRTAGSCDDKKLHYDGQKYFDVAFRSAYPVDFLVISLGTNDCKYKYNRNAKQIFEDLQWYKNAAEQINLLKRGSIMKTVFLSPANFNSTKDYFDANEELRSQLVNLLSKDENAIILDDLEILPDGVHYTESTHETVANIVYVKLKELGL